MDNQFNEQEINDQFNKQFGGGSPSGANPSGNPYPQPLPNANSSLVLGIISTFFGMIWCYWIGSVIGLVCGIIAIIHARKARTLFEAHPQTFKPASIASANAGRVLGIVGLCLSILGMLILIIAIVIGLAIGSLGGLF